LYGLGFTVFKNLKNKNPTAGHPSLINEVIQKKSAEGHWHLLGKCPATKARSFDNDTLVNQALGNKDSQTGFLKKTLAPVMLFQS
jgi:hypothetical protein